MYHGNYADDDEASGADRNNTGCKVFGLGLQSRARQGSFNLSVEIAGICKPDERLKPLGDGYSIVHYDFRIKRGTGI